MSVTYKLSADVRSSVKSKNRMRMFVLRIPPSKMKNEYRKLLTVTSIFINLILRIQSLSCCLNVDKRGSKGYEKVNAICNILCRYFDARHPTVCVGFVFYFIQIRNTSNEYCRKLLSTGRHGHGRFHHVINAISVICSARHSKYEPYVKEYI